MVTQWEEFPPGDAITAAAPAYILRWVPAYATGNASGWWELQSLADYVTGKLQLSEGVILDAPRDVPADALAWWAASKTGYPVMLVKSHSNIRRRWWSRQREPVYCIAPAVTP